MTKDIQLIRIKETALMVDKSVSGVRDKVTKRRKGIGDFPLPISGHKERLVWLRSEIEDWIRLRNEKANHLSPLSSSTQQLSPETMMLADRLGLDNSMTQDNNRKKKERKQ